MFALLLGLGLFLLTSTLAQKAIARNSFIDYKVTKQPDYELHTVFISHQSNYEVVPKVSGGLKFLEEFVNQWDGNIFAAINGGYFDPLNHRTTSFVVENSQMVADPRFNPRLMDNHDLQQYMAKILNRTELRIYKCGEDLQYDIQPHSSPIPPNCILKGSLGGGPGLLPQDTSIAEGFIDYRDGEKIRDAIGSQSLNARSAVGITKAGDIILAMVAQIPEKPLNSGISLKELSDRLASMGAVKAMNLDGGSSSSLYYKERFIYGRVDKEGKKIERPIKSVLLVKPRSL